MVGGLLVLHLRVLTNLLRFFMLFVLLLEHFLVKIELIVGSLFLIKLMNQKKKLEVVVVDFLMDFTRTYKKQGNLVNVWVC